MITAVEKHGIRWHTLEKILKHQEPPGYQQKQARPKPKIEAFEPVIAEILKADQKAPRKQRHSAKRIFERRKKEHEFTGGYTIVKAAVRAWRESRVGSSDCTKAAIASAINAAPPIRSEIFLTIA